MRLWHLLLGLSVISLVVLTVFLAPRHSGLDPESIQTTTQAPLHFLILPHHDIAKPLVLAGLATVTITPKEIYLLSPNHQEVGSCNICSYSPDLYPNEQGINILTPFLHQKFPGVPIESFVFKKNTPESELNIFIQDLNKKISTQSALVVGSIDFSHYLTKNQADQKDDETAKYIEDYDLEKIKTLGSNYLDSPPVLIALLKLAKTNNTSLNQIAHANSAEFSSNTTETTSYFVFSSSTVPSKVTPKTSHKQIRLLFAGDIMLGRSVNTSIQKQKDFAFPSRKITSQLPESDLFLANLESPFGEQCPQTDTGMVFCADPRSVATLTSLGVTAATLANNHISNQGKTGFDITTETLNKNKIIPITTSQIINLKSSKIGIIAFNDIPPYFQSVNKLTEDSLVNQIKEIRPKVDFLVFTPHWGNEYSLASSRQKNLARLAIDSGIDLIIGHHPHWVQEVEEYKGKLIYYSLGNFIFDQMWSQKTKEGIVTHITIENNKVISHTEIPIQINKNYQPEITKLTK